ncbi:hypothetical protein O2V63_07300 [Modestobacter sp. VKM Ac-2977]|uniref:hypothetical protein n=1 Tax=Modestobacter sp. VKM Ac-2977 TaxID=3004131 RepID=UPI0022AA380E|nr:hypothetical protein [Modestobacter sp. VKM Ac-2977]MCZ2820128.1 hypothetical protein [Modestobacter sp. VKM Ac-2977]
MTDEQAEPVVIRAQGRPDGGRIPVLSAPPHPGQPYPSLGIRWVEDGAVLGVTTWGSSSHPSLPRTARVSEGELTLTFGPLQDATSPPGSVDVMTNDVAAYTTLIEPPAGLAPSTPTRVHVGDEVVELPPAGTPPPPPIQLLPASARPPQPPELRRFEGTPTWDTEEWTPPGTAGP